jgi:tetratricopeptide (TPR) repeat protein
MMSASPPGGDPSAPGTDAQHALGVAHAHIEQARVGGDPGYYTLADVALDCALSRDPDNVEAARLKAHLGIQFHRFAEVEAVARTLAARHDGWLDHALLGDALMEQGQLDGAAEAYQASVSRHPGLPTYDRIGWLRWLWGDVDGALEMQRLAVSSGSPTDPEPYAWALVRLGWLHALRGEPADEIDVALALLPDYPPARLARGRIRLHRGDDRAAQDLRAVGRTVEALRALAEVDPTANVETARTQDPRGYAIWLSDRDPGQALALLDEELDVRKDPVTRMARAYAAFRLGHDVRDEALAVIATGIPEPRVLLQGGLILGDPALLGRAAASGPGLLPSERRQIEALAR